MLTLVHSDPTPPAAAVDRFERQADQSACEDCGRATRLVWTADDVDPDGITVTYTVPVCVGCLASPDWRTSPPRLVAS